MFGKSLSRIRKQLGISINLLGKEANISPTYVSRLQNNPDRIPSKNVAFKIIDTLIINNADEKLKDSDIAVDLLKPIAKKNNEDLNKIIEEFEEYQIRADQQRNDIMYKIFEKIYQNQYFKYKGKLMQLEDAMKYDHFKDYPLFDLKWLLTQKEIPLYYGREYFMVNDPDFDFLHYNQLSEEDVEMINSLIKAYISTKYLFLKEPKDYFLKYVDNHYFKFREELLKDIDSEETYEKKEGD